MFLDPPTDGILRTCSFRFNSQVPPPHPPSDLAKFWKVPLWKSMRYPPGFLWPSVGLVGGAAIKWNGPIQRSIIFWSDFKIPTHLFMYVSKLWRTSYMETKGSTPTLTKVNTHKRTCPWDKGTRWWDSLIWALIGWVYFGCTVGNSCTNSPYERTSSFNSNWFEFMGQVVGSLEQKWVFLTKGLGLQD